MVADSTAPTLVDSNARPNLLRRSSIFGNRKKFQSAEAQTLVSFLCVIIAVAIDFMGLTIQNPLMAFYAEKFDDAKDLGAGAATSAIMSSYALSQFIATPLFGFGSDRFGRRPMFLLSLFGSCVGFFAQAFADSLLSLCALRFFTGLFGGSRPVALAYIGDTIPPEQQPKYTAGLALAVSVSMFLGPVLGGSMGMVDLAFPCYFQAGAAFFGFILLYMYVKEPKKMASVSAKVGGGKASQATRPWKCWLIANATVGGALMFCMVGFQTILPVYASVILNLDQNKIGLIFGASGFSIALAQFLVFLPLTKVVSMPVIGCIGIPILGTACFLPFFEGKIWFVVVASAAQGFGAALAMPTVSMTVNLIAPPTLRGGMVSLTIMFQALMRVVAPLTFGPLYDVELAYPFYLMAGALFIAFGCEALLIMRVPLLKKQAPPPDKKLEDGSEATKSALQMEEAERAEILDNLHEVHDQIVKALDHWRGKKAAVMEGKTIEELGIMPKGAEPMKATEAQKHELGEWFADMLTKHNYKKWPDPDIQEIIKCMCRNAFPKVRDADFLTRFEDIEYIMESHLMLEQQWERFVLQRSLVELGTADFDWSAVTMLAARSRGGSEASETAEQADVRDDMVSI